MIKRVGPTWRGINVGKASADEVVAILGIPTSVEHEMEQTTYLYREGRFGQHKVVMNKGVTEYIAEDALAYPHDTFLMQFVDQYGEPNHVIWSGKDPSMRIAIFSDDGIFVSATFLPLSEAIVEHIFYYRPRSLVRLLIDFKDEISLTNPFSDSHVVGPRDPWFGQP